MQLGGQDIIQGVRIRIGVDGQEQVDKTTASLRKQGVETEKLTDSYKTLTASSTAALQKFYDKLAAGGAVSRGSVTPLIQQQELLRRQIENTYGSIEQATPAVARHYREFSEQVDKAKSAVRELTNAVKDQSGDVTQAGMHFTSMGDAIERMAGKHGKTVAQFAVGSLILREVISITKDLMKVADTGELQVYEDALKKVQKQLIENKVSTMAYIVAVGELAAAAARYDGEGMVRALENRSLRGKDLLAPVPRGIQPLYGPATPDFGQLLQAQAITSQRLAAEEAERVKKAQQVAAARASEYAILGRIEQSAQRRLEDLNIESDLQKKLLAVDRWRADEIAKINALQKVGNESKRYVIDQIRIAANEEKAAIERNAGLQVTLTQNIAKLKESTDKRLHEASLRAWADVTRQQTRIVMHARQYERDEILRAYRDTGAAAGYAFKEGIRSLLAGGNLKSAFTTFAEEIQAIFAQSLMAPINEWLKDLEARALGEKEIDAQGNWTGRYVAGTGDKNARNTLTGMQIIGGGISAYSAAQSNEGTRTSSIIGSAAGVYASTGNIYAAAAAAIVSAIGSYMGEAQRHSEYKYGIPTIDNGQAGMLFPKNLNPAEITQMIASMQTVINDTYNSFAKIMLKLPGAQMPGLPNFGPDSFQPEASGKYLKHFQEYLTNTLPKKIAEMFRAGMEKAFTGSGMTKAAFDRFWAEAEGLDAGKRAQFWTDMAEGVAAFARAQANMAAVGTVLNPNVMTGGTSLGIDGPFKFDGAGGLIENNTSRFTADLRVAGAQLFQIGREMLNLTGPEKVAAFRALGQGIEGVTRSLQMYIEEIGNTIKSLAGTFGDERLAKAVARETDPKKKADLLFAEYERNLQRIGNAAALGLSPAEVENLTRRNIALLNQIYELDPTAEMYAWWQRQMAALEALSKSQLEQMATKANEQVLALIATLKPFSDWFLGLPVDLDPAWAALDTSINGAAEALAELAKRINDTAKPNTDPPGGGDGPDGGGDGGNDRPKDDPDGGKNNITVNINGPSYGLRDLQAKVAEAVKAMMAANPDSFTGEY